jgi:methyltransferase-like protein 6
MSATAASLVRPQTKYFNADFDFGELASEEEDHQKRVSTLLSGEIGESRLIRAALAADRAASRWNVFYTKNGRNAYKPRHFIVEAFQSLRVTAGRVVDIGCGAGANIWPIIEKTNATHVFGTDVAPAALDALAAHPDASAAIESGKLTLFLWDFSRNSPPLPLPQQRRRNSSSDTSSSPLATLSSSSSASSLWYVETPPIEEGTADSVLLTFTASAMHPRDHIELLRGAVAMLAPGGRLLFRDHGARDLAQLRAVDDSILLPSMNERGDGTLAYFFTLTEVETLMRDVGLMIEELSHACVTNINRKTGTEMKRVFVHAVGRKPE